MDSQQPVREDLLTIDEAAEFLKLSKATLARFRVPGNRQYGPKFVKLATCVRYRRADLDDWISSNSHGGVRAQHMLGGQQERSS